MRSLLKKWLLNGVYTLLLTALCPIILWRVVRHGRYRRGLHEKFLGHGESMGDGLPVAWFHAVSVGEVVQLQKIVDEFRTQSNHQFRIVVSTSTDTGYDLALKRFPDCQVIWFPLDFSWAVRAAVRRVNPALVVLMELELWPNFVAECNQQQIPVAVINARMSDHSFRGYRRIRRFVAPMISRLALVAAQSAQYADRLRQLGARPDVIHVTGSIKFDGVLSDRRNENTRRLARLFGIHPHECVFVAGSTQAPEEQLALDAWHALRSQVPELRLILVPRHRERFDEVAALIRHSGAELLRRSEVSDKSELAMDFAESDVEAAVAKQPVVLLDTIGELSACWGLADIAFVGGSFGARGGQNMIEPAAFGAAVMFGPNTWNFRDVVAAFRHANACVQMTQPDDLLPTLTQLAADTASRQQLGARATQVVQSQQGATARTGSLLLELVAGVCDSAPATDQVYPPRFRGAA